MEDAPSILIENKFLENWTLNNYVYQSRVKTHSLLAAGAASLFNHNSDEKKTVDHTDSTLAGKLLNLISSKRVH